MIEKRLPNAQILFALLFSLVALLSPLAVRSLNVILLLAATTGLALCAVTARIGWMVLMQGRPAIYPFRGWSISLLRLATGGKMPQQEKPPPSAAEQKWLGIASLACGGLGALAAFLAMLFALTQTGA